MPPRKNLAAGGSGITAQNACCFCQRPEDDAVPGQLAALLQFKNYKFHNACLAYSFACAKVKPTNATISSQTFKIPAEVARGRNVICSVCRRPGATIVCSTKGCQRSYHLPCAREAAMNMTQIKVAPAVVPVFATPSGGSGVTVLCCGEHAAECENPLAEPAGVWFEKCGGWDCHCPAAAGLAAGKELASDEAPVPNGTGSSDQTNEPLSAKLEHIGSTAAAGAAAAIAVAAADAAAAAAAAPPKSTFAIPGHQWEVSACVQGPLPPLRPGEGRVLGVTLSAPVYEAFLKTTQAFMTASANAASSKSPAELRQIVPLHELGGCFTKPGMRKITRSLENIIKDAARVKSLQEVQNLPEMAPCHRYLEAFCIGKDDPRPGLANELGVRVKASAATIKPCEVLGVYGGLQLFQEDFNRMAHHDEELFESVGFQCLRQLSTKLESYAADEDQVPLKHPDVPEVKFAWEAAPYRLKDPSGWLVTSAFLYGNITCLINDPLLDPLGPSPPPGTPAPILDEPNCKMITCLIRGWPFTVLVSTRDIKPGQELLYLYNGNHDDPSASGYWANLKQMLVFEEEALKALQLKRENEELKKRLQMLEGRERSGTLDAGESHDGRGVTLEPDGSAVIGQQRQQVLQQHGSGGRGASGSAYSGNDGSGECFKVPASVAKTAERSRSSSFMEIEEEEPEVIELLEDGSQEEPLADEKGADGGRGAVPAGADHEKEVSSRMHKLERAQEERSKSRNGEVEQAARRERSHSRQSGRDNRGDRLPVTAERLPSKSAAERYLQPSRGREKEQDLREKLRSERPRSYEKDRSHRHRSCSRDRSHRRERSTSRGRPAKSFEKSHGTHPTSQAHHHHRHHNLSSRSRSPVQDLRDTLKSRSSASPYHSYKGSRKYDTSPRKPSEPYDSRKNSRYRSPLKSHRSGTAATAAAAPSSGGSGSKRSREEYSRKHGTSPRKERRSEEKKRDEAKEAPLAAVAASELPPELKFAPLPLLVSEDRPAAASLPLLSSGGAAKPAAHAVAPSLVLHSNAPICGVKKQALKHAVEERKKDLQDQKVKKKHEQAVIEAEAAPYADYVMDAVHQHEAAAAAAYHASIVPSFLTTQAPAMGGYGHVYGAQWAYAGPYAYPYMDPYGYAAAAVAAVPPPLPMQPPPPPESPPSPAAADYT